MKDFHCIAQNTKLFVDLSKIIFSYINPKKLTHPTKQSKKYLPRCLNIIKNFEYILNVSPLFDYSMPIINL